MSRLPMAALVLATLAGTAAAQPAPAPAPAAATSSFDDDLAKILAQPGGLTADQAADLAAKASVTARRKHAEVEEGRTGLSSITVALVPITKLSVGYTRTSYIPPLPFVGGSLVFPQNNYHVGADVAVPVTDLLMRLPPAKKATELGVEATELQERQARIDAAAGARVAYYEYVRASLQVAVAQRMLIQVNSTLDQIRALAASDHAVKGDVLRLEATAAQAELGIAQATELTAFRAEQLRIAIGAEPDAPIAIGEDVRQPVAAGEVGSTGDLARTAAGTRLEVKALDKAEAALAQQARADRIDRLPKLNLFASVVDDRPNSRAFPPADEFKFTWAAGAQLTWSLNDYLNVGPKDDKTAAKQRELAADRSGVELQIRVQVAAARQAVLIADKSYATSQKELTAAEENYRVRQELLAAERVTAVELVDAETELTRARLTAIDALIDRRIAQVNLDHATGADIH